MTTIGSSVIAALGGGSGIDTAALVSSLVSAVREPKESVITSRQSLNSTRISALASASSSLDTFADALSSLLSGTGFSGTPASNDTSIATVSLLPGGVPSGLPAQLRVQQLASAQTLASAPVGGATGASPVGLGTLTLTVGGTTKTITITAANNSYAGLAKAINDAGTGVTASVITDNQGTRLVMKGATGEANDFQLTKEAGNTADADLANFTWNGTSGGMTRLASAQDSIIFLDGVEQRYSSNTIDTAINNLRIDLNKASPGTDVTLASTEPTTSMRDLMVEYVAAYNVLMKALNTASAAGTETTGAGALAGDSAVREIKKQLSRMTSTTMASSGPYKTLVDLGVSTNRDGTLTLNTAKLDAAIAADPAAVTQILNPVVKSAGNPGLAGLMDDVRDRIKAEDGPLASSQRKYQKLAESFADQLAKLDRDMDNYEAQLSTTYSRMQTQLTALKATQSYLDQQVAAWNNGGS